MADEKQSVLIDIKIEGTEAIKRQQELKQSLIDAKEALNLMDKATQSTSVEFIKQEAVIKSLNQQINANGNVLKQVKFDTDSVSGAYASLNQKSAEAAQKAKDLAVAYGMNDSRTKEATASAKLMSDQLKEVDKSVGQNQRSVGDYGIALQGLPGVFGEMADSGQAVLVKLRNTFASVKDATMQYSEALNVSKAANIEAAVSAEAATTAETQLAVSEAAGTATAEQAAAAEALRATATATATVATEAGSAAMKIFKIAMASTGIGLLVVALGAIVSYFTQTNEGSKEFARISSALSAVMQSGVKILGSYGKLLFSVATMDLKGIKEAWTQLTDNIKNATSEIGKNYQAGLNNERNNQMMKERERTWSGERLKLMEQYDAAVLMAGKRAAGTDAEKMKQAKLALKIDDEIYQNDLKIAQNKLKLIENEDALNSKHDLDKIQGAKNAVQEVINAHSRQHITVSNLLGKTEDRINAADKAGVKSAQEASNKRIMEAEKEAQAEMKLSEKKMNASIKTLQDELKYNQLVQDEMLAGQKLTTEEWLKIDNDRVIKERDSKIQELNDQKQNELNAAKSLSDEKTKLLNETQTSETATKIALLDEQIQIEKDKSVQSEVEKNIAVQEAKTKIAINNAAADDKLKAEKLAREATDLQNEYDTAVLHNDNLFALESQQLEAKRIAELEAAKKTGADVHLINQKYTALNIDLKKKERDANINAASSFAGNIATIFGKNTKVGKAAASAQIAIDTYKGAMAAFSSMQSIPIVGIPLGIAAAAAVAVTGAKAIKDVWAVQSGLPGDGGGGGASVGGAVPNVSAASVTGGIVSRDSGQTEQQSTQQAVNNALKNNPSQPVLVTNDITIATDQKVQLKTNNSL